MSEHDPEPGLSESDLAAREIIACAERTLLATGAKIEFREDWIRPHAGAFAGRRRHRRGGLLAPIGRLAMRAIKAGWKRAARDFNFGHLVGKGILEPATGRFMIDFGSFAQIHTGGETFGGRSGRSLQTLEPFPSQGTTADMMWLLQLLRGVTDAVLDEHLHGTSCRRLSAHADLRKASAKSEEGLSSPSVERYEQLRALPVTVWIDEQHVRRVQFDHPSSRRLTLELWDYGLSPDQFDWSRLPTFKSPSEAARYAGEELPRVRPRRSRFSTPPASPS